MDSKEKGAEDRLEATRQIADELYLYRQEVRRLTLRVAELKSSWSYRVSAPIRLIERAVVSVQKRAVRRHWKGVANRKMLDSPDRERSLSIKTADEVYKAWANEYGQLTEGYLQLLRRDIETFVRRPLVSVAIIASEDAAADDLIASAETLRSQAYPHLDIHVACSAPLAATALSTDSRVCFAPVMPGSSAPAIFNDVLKLAKGEYFIAINPGDLLSPDAIYLAVRALQADPSISIIYGDEDEFHGGQYCNPFFKPGWNPELLLAFDYLGTAVVYRTEALRKLGGARTSVKHAWRWDLALRATNAARAPHISRLPFVLCHLGRRSLEEKRPAAGTEVVAEELARRGETAQITVHHHYLVLSRMSPKTTPHVTIIVATRDRCHLLRRCLAGLLHRTQYPHYDLIVVDNDSCENETLEYFEQLKSDSRVQIIGFPGAFNFSKINNMAARIARGDVLALVNNDVDVISPLWLAEMVGGAIRPDVGAVGAKLYYSDDTVQHAGIVIGLEGMAGHIFRGCKRSDPGPFNLTMLPQDVSAVTGACLVMRRSIYGELGGMDEGFAVEFNDIDLCLRVREIGLRVIWTPHAELYHQERGTRGTIANIRTFAEQNRFRRRWTNFLVEDPFFNPNLSLTDPRRVPAFPPRANRL
jgi:GT2 family glycosyltransferase